MFEYADFSNISPIVYRDRFLQRRKKKKREKGRIEWKKFNIRRKRMGEVSLLSSLHRPVSNVLNSRDRISPRVIIISLRIIVER